MTDWAAVAAVLAAGRAPGGRAERIAELQAEWNEFRERTGQRERAEALLGPGPHRLSDLAAVYGRGHWLVS